MGKGEALWHWRWRRGQDIPAEEAAKARNWLPGSCDSQDIPEEEAAKARNQLPKSCDSQDIPAEKAAKDRTGSRNPVASGGMSMTVDGAKTLATLPCPSLTAAQPEHRSGDQCRCRVELMRMIILVPGLLWSWWVQTW